MMLRQLGCVTIAMTLAACGVNNDPPSSTTSADRDAGTLAATCPSTIVIQTDWFPQAEHGGVYELLGDDATTNKSTGATLGSLVVDGEPTGIALEIRTGGPFLQSPVVTEMYADDDITFGFVGTDVAVARYADAPTIAVFNALTVNPQVLLWNSELHPSPATLSDVASVVDTVYVFGEPWWITFLENQGVIDPSTVDSGYQGNPILATEDVIHQGFVTSEPHTYANLATGSISTGYALLHDLGWINYPQNLAIRADRLEELRPCLELLVPVLQQAQLDFISDPRRTNARIVEAVKVLDSWWTQTAASTSDSVDKQVSLGIVGNGSTSTFGDLEIERLNEFLRILVPILRSEGITVPDIHPSDIATNEFLDPSLTWTG